MFNNPPLRSCGGSVFARPRRCAATISCKKITVIISATVARAIQDRLHTQQGLWIFLSCLRLLPGQRFMPFVGVGGYWNLVLLVHRFSDHCGLGGHWVRTYFSIVSISNQNMSGGGIGTDICNPRHICESVFSAQPEIRTPSAPAQAANATTINPGITRRAKERPPLVPARNILLIVLVRKRGQNWEYSVSCTHLSGCDDRSNRNCG